MMMLPTLAVLLTIMVACDDKVSEQNRYDFDAIDGTNITVDAKALAEFEKKLIGMWELDSETFNAAIKAENEADMDPNDLESSMALLDMESSFNFKDDGSVEMYSSVMGMKQTDECEWKITKIEGNVITALIDDDPAFITFISDDRLHISPPPEEASSMPKSMSKLYFDRTK